MPYPSPFIGAYQSKLVDQKLDDFGTIANPIFTSSIAAASIDSIKSISGTVNTVGDLIIVPAIPGKRIVIFALSIFTGTGANCNINFTDGIGGPILFSILIVSTAQSPIQFGQAVSLPSFLFCTSPDKALNVNLTATITGVANISYFTI